MVEILVKRDVSQKSVTRQLTENTYSLLASTVSISSCLRAKRVWTFGLKMLYWWDYLFSTGYVLLIRGDGAMCAWIGSSNRDPQRERRIAIMVSFFLSLAFSVLSVAKDQHICWLQLINCRLFRLYDQICLIIVNLTEFIIPLIVLVFMERGKGEEILSAHFSFKMELLPHSFC